VSWRIAIDHVTTHRYTGDVFASYNEARVMPLSLPRQICTEANLDVTPAARTHRYWDYWGSAVTVFDIHTPHDELVVHSTAVVETSPMPAVAPATTWAELAGPDLVDAFAEYLAPTRYVPETSEHIVEDLRGAATPDGAARGAVDWVRGRLRYQPGATDVQTSAVEALQQGEGVCQDFAHLTLAVLRTLGIPARYVSGYLHPSPDAVVGESVTGQSHAWVEWWCGDWLAWDPTHGVPVGERHVLVARGRDYADVTPLKGVYHGAAALSHEVRVELTRTA
jgi:transglutaminase-like putative cysteine protease